MASTTRMRGRAPFMARRGVGLGEGGAACLSRSNIWPAGERCHPAPQSGPRIWRGIWSHFTQINLGHPARWAFGDPVLIRGVLLLGLQEPMDDQEDFLRQKARQCRDMARYHQGEAAAALLEMASEL